MANKKSIFFANKTIGKHPNIVYEQILFFEALGNDFSLHS
jgi:hypothetical protein